MTEKFDLLTANPVYKPFRYPWAYDAWLAQQRVHWLPEEVPLAEDVKDWHRKLNDGERHLVTQIFRFFTQSDVEVNNCYMKKYSQVFKPTEVCMMLSAFSNIETVHIAAYSHLLDTIGMPESEYSMFMKYKQMKDKYDYMQNFSVENKHEIAKTLAAFGAFTEGLQLFASFAILLNFPRFNKLKGMGQIVTWSVRDETLHCESTIKLWHTFLHENPEIRTPELMGEIRDICKTIVEHEDAFIDLAFEHGPVEGLSADQVKSYIRFIADRRLSQLGMDSEYNIPKNPLPWIDDMLNATEHVNFFENRATEYSKAATTGSWEIAFSGKIMPRIYTRPGCPACADVGRRASELGITCEWVILHTQTERDKFYDEHGLSGADRTMPKAMVEGGRLLMTSQDIIAYLETLV